MYMEGNVLVRVIRGLIRCNFLLEIAVRNVELQYLIDSITTFYANFSHMAFVNSEHFAFPPKSPVKNFDSFIVAKHAC